MSLHRGDFRWFLIIGAMWAALIVSVFAPASLWLQVTSVHVEDTIVGVTPEMNVDRAVNREFSAEWTVTVMRKGSNGYSAYCTANGANDYSPDTSLPDDLTLDWWTWPTKCPLPVGGYRVKTLWVLHLPLFPDKEVRNVSNVFKVTDAPPS